MLLRVVELKIFITFAYEIILVDGVWGREKLIYEELKDIFEENKHDFLTVKAVL